MIRTYQPADRYQVATLIGNCYERSYEACLLEALRENGDVAAEFVWDSGDGPDGHICMARHLHPDSWYILATVAVRPEKRGAGIGSDLVRAAVEAARQQDASAVTVLGHARYYQRFGFTRTAAERLETPFSLENTLMYPIRIETAGIEAELVYPPAYSRL